MPEALKPTGSLEEGRNTRREAGYYPIRPHQEKANANAAAAPTAIQHRPQLAASSGSNEVIKRSLAHQSHHEPTWTRGQHTRVEGAGGAGGGRGRRSGGSKSGKKGRRRRPTSKTGISRPRSFIDRGTKKCGRKQGTHHREAAPA